MQIYIITSTTEDKWEVCPSTWLSFAKNKDEAKKHVRTQMQRQGKENEKIIDCIRYNKSSYDFAKLLQTSIVE